MKPNSTSQSRMTMHYPPFATEYIQSNDYSGHRTLIRLRSVICYNHILTEIKSESSHHHHHHHFICT